MSPIDDELRTALQRRATSVAPSPDPLAGIERRAGRMRRNRLAASVAGSVLAVAAVATAVPLLTGPAAQDPPQVALRPPSAAPTAPSTSKPVPPSYALDAGAPWAYRGTPLEELGFDDVLAREYGARHGGLGAVIAPLWGQVDEPSGRSELVFVATVGTEDRWGLVRSSESGPEFVVDEPLADPTLALAAALPGDEVARLVVVASPEAGELQYGPDDASEYTTMTRLADGVAVTPLEGDPATATYRVLDPSGAVLLREPVPPVAPPSGQEPSAPDSPLPPPTNVVDWPLRGQVPAQDLEDAEAVAAEQAAVPVEQVASRPLYGGERDGRRYGLAQVWFGGDAQVLAWVRDPGGTTTGVLLGPTAPGPAVLAAQLDDVLVVVPEPRTGQVLYAPDAASEPVAVPDQGTEAAVLVQRPAGAAADRLLVLDGNGDPDRPVYRGTVEQLLAASS